MNSSKRVGFLFNHYSVHQVPHAAPYAFELSRNHLNCDVIIACSSIRQLHAARKIGELYPGYRCKFKLLRPPWHYYIIDLFESKWRFKKKTGVLKNNLAFFRSLDVLVAPERQCIKLRTKYNLKSLKLIHTRHGAGDREGGFDEKSGAFDLTLLPGKKYVDRLSELGYLEDGKYQVAGWPKFEVVKGFKREKERFFNNDNPVLVYNPHFDQSVSSWEPMGLKVLEFFAENQDFNLIFAPHVVLFMRHKLHNAYLPRKYCKLPNILIDKGSVASTDMTYILAADIYLGDVSSQVYEFLYEPRPCIFLNGHQVDWKSNPYYVHWKLGQVVDDVDNGLRPAIEQAFTRQAEFLPKQRKAFDYTFHTDPEKSAAQRGADIIAGFIENL